jgi:serine/threonine-protein phosphatase PGAM5
MSQRIIHLVRHGQIDPTRSAPEPQGWRLTALGREQAVLTAQRLTQLPIACIHHSTAPRAVETAEILAAHLPGVPRHPSPLLVECPAYVPPAFREWYLHMRIEPPDQDKHDVPAVMRPWLNLWSHHVDLAAVDAGAAQAEQAFARYFRAAGTMVQHEVVVSHCALLAYLVCRVLHISPDVWINLEIDNCGISEVRIDATGQRQLLSFNDVGHLPYAMRTSNEQRMEWFERI